MKLPKEREEEHYEDPALCRSGFDRSRGRPEFATSARELQKIASLVTDPAVVSHDRSETSSVVEVPPWNSATIGATRESVPCICVLCNVCSDQISPLDQWDFGFRLGTLDLGTLERSPFSVQTQ